VSESRVQRAGVTRRNFLKLGGGALASAYVLGLAGCGGGGSGGGGTLKFANWVSSEEATRANMDKVLRAFEKKNPGITVENVAIPFEEMRQQLLTLFAGGEPPDVVQLNGPWPQEFGSQGVLADMREFVDGAYLKDNYEGAIEAGEYKGQLYALPLSLTPHGLWYNKDLMEQAGLNPERPPQTLEELDGQMATIKSKVGGDVYPIGIDTTKIDYALTQFWPYFYAFGARPLYGNEINFDTPEVANALEWLRGLADKKYTPLGQGIRELRELQADDKIVFRLDGPYLVGILGSLNDELQGNAFYDKFGVTTVPVGVNGSSQTLADLHQIGISAQTQNKEGAYSLVEFLVSSQPSITDYQIPYGVLPALQSDLKSDAFSDPVSQSYIQDIFATMIAGPYGPDYGKAQQSVIRALQQAALEDVPIEQITARAEKDLKLIYGQ
jgi:multiple sugar transport system substrate-binding protein